MRQAFQRTALLATLAFGLPTLAQAAVEYYKWTPVTLPVASGASCGNGTPARVFVNRTPMTTKTLVYFEGGGACWNQKSCQGKGKLSEVASNPNGVPENYFSQVNIAAFGMGTPLMTRTPLLGKIYTQSWNIVYVPYCTGDVHAGVSVQTYSDADSGPLFPAPQNGTAAQYPSLPLQNKVRSLWGVDRADGVASELIAMYPEAGDVSDLSTLNSGLPKVFPKDRFGYMTFQEDGVFSAFSYVSFYPEIAALTGKARDEALNVLWRKDLANWKSQLDKTPSTVGYYFPTWRPFLKAHTLATMDFKGKGIEETGINSVGSF